MYELPAVLFIAHLIHSFNINFHIVILFLILSELEQNPPFYTIFEPRRDMKAGEMFEFEKEMEKATKSKRVIVLLSEYTVFLFLLRVK